MRLACSVAAWLAFLTLVEGKWRRMTSTNPAPGIFENVCIGRTCHGCTPTLFIAGNNQNFDFLPANVSLGEPAQAPVYRDSSMTHTVNFAREPHIAHVVLHYDESVLDMANRLSEEHIIIDSPIDVHYMGGTTILMHSPCDLDDSFHVTITEEGPMLHRAVNRAMRHWGSAQRLSLLLDNKCPHHAYRDELRDMLIGRDHSVFKVQPSSLTCVERLVTPPPPSRMLENSLKQYFVDLSQRASEQSEEEMKRRAMYETVARREAVRRGHPPSCIGDDGEVLGVCSDQASSESYEAAAAREAEIEARLTARPFRVAVIQRTSHERRILNLDELIMTIQRSLAEASPDTMRNGKVETLFLDNVELWEQIRRVQEVDVLIGVTGSGLSTVAFLRPGSIVIELASSSYETDTAQMLILQAHGSLLRGIISYRKSYVKPIASAPFDAANSAVRSEMISHAQFNSFLIRRNEGSLRKDFHAIVNSTDVWNTLLLELQHRMLI